VPVEVEKCQDRVECFNADLKADWERWQSNKRQDFKQLLTGMADKNLNYYEKVRALTTSSRTSGSSRRCRAKYCAVDGRWAKKNDALSDAVFD